MTSFHTYRAISPSNIAFIKYWGKKDKDKQWPANDSLSMTLKNSLTTTEASISTSSSDSIIFNDEHLSQSNHKYLKIKKHLDFLRTKLNYKEYLDIKTVNTFPSDAGIASSASGFSALTLASLAAWTNSSNLDELNQKGYSSELISSLSRMGSGSSCRSLYGGFVHWASGSTHDSQKTTQVFNENHWQLSDLIIIISETQKPISSSEAHMRAWSSPYYTQRLESISNRITSCIDAINTKSLTKLGNIIEEDSLEMHKIIMTSEPPICYLTPECNKFIEWVKETRINKNVDMYFTIDAGSNVHIICETVKQNYIYELIKKAFNYRIIVDSVGSGPKLEAF